jgi:type VI secretion system secreted protein VgrG
MKTHTLSLPHRFSRRLVACVLTSLVFWSGLQTSRAAVLFSQNFQDQYTAGNTTLAAAGWSGGGSNDWSSSFDTAKYGVATAVSLGNNNYNALSGVSHSVSGISFATSGIHYTIATNIATNNSSGFTTGNRVLSGVSLSTSDPNGIYAYLGNNTANTLCIAIGNPVGALTTYASVALSGTITSNTFYKLTLDISRTSATATVLDLSNNILGTTTYTFSTALTSTSTYGAVRFGQRDGGTSALDYISSVSVISVPEPSTVLLGLAAITLLWLKTKRSRRGITLA